MRKNLQFCKKIGSSLFVAIGLLFSISATGQDTTTGLKLHYTFDNVSGTTVPDVSGNNQNGTLQGNPLLVDGKITSALQLGPKTDFISLPANVNTGWDSFTFSTWVKFSELKNATRFFDLGNGADGSNNFMAFIPSFNGDNQIMCLRLRPASGTAYNALSTQKVPVGEWAHVALTYSWDNATSKATATIYLNGSNVGTTNEIPIKPSDFLPLTENNYLGISRWNQDPNGFNGIMDDVRFYNRALTSEDVMTLYGYPASLISAWKNLNLGDLSAVTSNINLPTDLGNGISVNWSSTRPDAITNEGVVLRPEKFDVSLKLTATITYTENEVTYTLTKEFNATVIAFNLANEVIAIWNFASEHITFVNDTVKVSDATDSQYIGTVMNNASIRTIGETDQFNVLDLGNGTGYFDMGTAIGEAIYSLTDYTMHAYFRVDEDYDALSSAGNFIWAFSNSDNSGTDRNGYVIGRLNNQGHNCTTQYWGAAGNQLVAVGSPATKGSWQHMAFVQEGTTGTIYINGIQAATGTMTNNPANSIVLPGRKGTLYNFLGRSTAQASDVYLRKTLIHDFQILRVPLSAQDFPFYLNVPEKLDLLNAAYAENPNYKSASLLSEAESLSLGDLSQVTSNLTLPAQGSSDNEVKIKWTSSCPEVISNSGVVVRPNYYNFDLTLTATLTKGVQSVTKSFPATVLVNPGSEFVGDLIVKYDFNSVNDRTVTSAAEKQFTGTLVKDASIRTIGTAESGIFNVLDLGQDSSYFDLGLEVGKVLYHLEDYTISAYYRIDETYEGIDSNGNFLWTLSNTDNAMSNQNGYIIASLKNQSQSITPGYYTAESGNQAVTRGGNALKGEWHNLTYVQSGNNGVLYVDGMPMANAEITNLPKTALNKGTKLGTPFNWIGRSNYVGDVYLRNTLVYDFRLYKKALSDEEIQSTVLNVGNTIAALDEAYVANPNIPSGLKAISNSPYSIGTENGSIRIAGLTGTEKVSVFDIAGREMKVSNPSEITTGKGIWIVRINNFASKVVVQ